MCLCHGRCVQSGLWSEDAGLCQRDLRLLHVNSPAIPADASRLQAPAFMLNELLHSGVGLGRLPECVFVQMTAG